MSTPDLQKIEPTTDITPQTPAIETVEIGNKDFTEAGNNESTIRSESQKYNAGTKSKQMIHEEYNSSRNLLPILQAIEEGRARDLNDEPKHTGEPAVIIGSGPSLDEALPLLAQWKYGIVCSPSHALTLMYHGIEPTHILALDPFESWAYIDGVDWSKTRTKLILNPGVWPDLVENWPNEMLLYRQNLGRADSYYATTQRHMYSTREGYRHKAEFKLHIRTEITVFACTPPAQLYAADRMGYEKQFLVGCDFAFTQEKDRFTNYTVKFPERTVKPGNSEPFTVPIEWEEHVHPYTGQDWGERQQEQLIMTNNGLPTTQILLYYKKNMISAWRLYGKTIWVVGKGAIVEMPRISIQKLIADQDRLPAPRSEEWNKKTAERYLAGIGAYVLVSEPNEQGNRAHSFIESGDPEVQIHQFMVKNNRLYICPVCGAGIEGHDDTDHTGMTCPACGGPPIFRKAFYDIGANMARIRNLLTWVKDHPVEPPKRPKMKPKTPLAGIATRAPGDGEAPAGVPELTDKIPGMADIPENSPAEKA